MPKRNYGYEKRQKELNKQRKQEQKQQRRLDRRALSQETNTSEDEATAADTSSRPESA